MRGPLLSGPLGSPAALAALVRSTAGRAPVLVLGPPWLADAVASGGRTLLFVEREARPLALRVRRRARREGRTLDIAVAGAELPLKRGAFTAIVVENVAGLAGEEALAWMSALVPCLAPGGVLIAADV